MRALSYAVIRLVLEEAARQLSPDPALVDHDGVSGFPRGIVFADSLENMLAIATADELDGWRNGRGDFAHFLRLADSLALTGLGRGTGPMMSYGAYHGADGELFPRGLFSQRAIVEPLPLTQITEDVSHA
ncbi:hypothetical protein ABIB85_004443 [Bradyrhizobium sp. JR1.5]|uniref:hypothetical protein n=1 Tax=unclassified Bradyrhizobium TaxID=2631580 RepID=UPI003397C592